MTAFILIICLSEYLLAGTATAPFALYNTLLAFFILLPIAAALSFGKFSSAEIRYAYLPFALCAACFGIFAPTAYAVLAPELWQESKTVFLTRSDEGVWG